jgi:hypothetical protein
MDDGSYYAKDGIVWKSPIQNKHADGSLTITIGFPVCKMHDAAEGQEGIVAAMLNRSALLDEFVEIINRALALKGGWREAVVELEDHCSEPVRLKNMMAAADQLDDWAVKARAAIAKATA